MCAPNWFSPIPLAKPNPAPPDTASRSPGWNMSWPMTPIAATLKAYAPANVPKLPLMPKTSGPARSGFCVAMASAMPEACSSSVLVMKPLSVARLPLASDVTSSIGPTCRLRLRSEVMPGVV